MFVDVKVCSCFTFSKLQLNTPLVEIECQPSEHVCSSRNVVCKYNFAVDIWLSIRWQGYWWKWCSEIAFIGLVFMHCVTKISGSIRHSYDCWLRSLQINGSYKLPLASIALCTKTTSSVKLFCTQACLNHLGLSIYSDLILSYERDENAYK